MKAFSKARKTQRDSQNYIEKRIGKREIELTRRKKRHIKKGRQQSSQSTNQQATQKRKRVSQT